MRAGATEAETPAVGDECDARAVAPDVGRGTRRPDVDVVQTAEPSELLRYQAAFRGALGCDGDVLPLAAAASAEYWAAGLDAIRAGTHDVCQLGTQESAVPLHDARADEVAGRGERGEDDAALVMGQCIRAVREALDREIERRVVGGRHAAPVWTRGDTWGKCAA